MRKTIADIVDRHPDLESCSEGEMKKLLALEQQLIRPCPVGRDEAVLRSVEAVLRPARD